MSYVSIGSAIKTLLEEVTQLNKVWGYEPKELLEYPCATVTALGHQNNPHDLAGNRRRYMFMIRLYYRTDNSSDGEGILRSITDLVINKLESNVSLNSTCDFHNATESKWLFQERELPVRVVELTIEAHKRVLR